MVYKLISIAGLFVLLLLAFLMSENRKKISWKLVLWGTGLQLVFALFILKTRAGFLIFDWVKIVIEKLISFSDKGAEFLFGKLVNDPGIGAIVACKVLPIIIFVSSLSAILYFLGVIQFVIKYAAKVMQKTMKTSGAESFGTALFIFMGIEVTTAIRNYIEKMTRSELFTIMTAFMPDTCLPLQS
jgi:CNT family concentrative nucleoside transporter